MSHWENIRAKARAQHAVLARQAGNDPRPVAVLSAAETESGITSIGLPAGHPLLYGSAEAALHTGIIWYNQDAPIGLQLLARAHEYAHLRLHAPPLLFAPRRTSRPSRSMKTLRWEHSVWRAMDHMSVVSSNAMCMLASSFYPALCFVRGF